MKNLTPLTKNDQNEAALQIRDVQNDAIVQFVAKAKVLPRAELEARLYTFLQDRFDRLTDTVENQKDFIIEDITKQL